MVKKLTNIKERVLYFSKQQGISIESFLASIDMTYGSFKGEAKQRSLNSDAIEKMLNKYPNVNPVWLLTGEGDMEVGTESKAESKSVLSQMSHQEVLITPLVSKYSQREFIVNFKNESYIQKLNKVPWINSFGNDPAMFTTFEVKGDKMDDNSPQSFLDGDLVLAIELKIENWPNFEKTKASYVVLHDSLGILICRIIGSSQSENSLTCHFLNDFYQDIYIDKSTILTIYRIVELRREPRF